VFDHFQTLAVGALISRGAQSLTSVVPEQVEVAAGF
jgi:hypothetical protein